MKTISTAEEFAKVWINDLKNDKSGFTTPQLLIEFAKLHVEAEMKEPIELLREVQKQIHGADTLPLQKRIYDYLKSYPTTNIK